jgi:gamma-glutamyltranspeptidase/glutathione hydrolase
MYFNSRRSAIHAKHGMVATSQPLASMAGLRMMMNGGNAIDAAVATAAALNVVEPMSTGVGGDLFSLIWIAKEKRVVALNASGRAPSAAAIEDVIKAGHTGIPNTSAFAVSVPGTVNGWDTILKEYGTMPLSEVLKPAIQYAEEGFPVSDIVAYQWQRDVEKLQLHPSGNELLLNGRAPNEGDVFFMPNLAKVLRGIAEGGPDAFYKGPVAEKIAAYIQELGGWMTTQDLANDAPDWDQPISTDYHGVTCWECPPNGQGLIALIAMNIVEGMDIKGMGSQSVEAYHHEIEAMRLAFADGMQYIGDPRTDYVPIDELLSKSYAEDRRGLINKDRAMAAADFGKIPAIHDTVYLSAVDEEGNGCSFINSLFAGFGSGLVVPGTGIALQNRAALFSLNPDHPNALAPNKRPFHTIIPAMATKNDELWLSFGVMGGFMQAQGHMQVISNMVDFDMGPQQAIDALRFSVDLEGGVTLEEEIDPKIVKGLEDKGHTVGIREGYARVTMGGAQIIERNPETGMLMGASEPRKSGSAVGW